MKRFALRALLVTSAVTIGTRSPILTTHQFSLTYSHSYAYTHLHSTGIGIQQGFQLRDRFIKSKPLESIILLSHYQLNMIAHFSLKGTNEPQSGTVAGRSVTMIDKIVEKGKNIKDKTTVHLVHCSITHITTHLLTHHRKQ